MKAFWDRLPEYQQNPFKVQGIVKRTISVGAKDTGRVAVNRSTGEEEYQIITPAKLANVDHDNKTFVKIFPREEVGELSGEGKLLLMFLVYHVKVNTDTVSFLPEDVKKWTKLSKNKYYAAMEELEGKVLARVQGSKIQYYINPNYCYNGNRVNLFKRQ